MSSPAEDFARLERWRSRRHALLLLLRVVLLLVGFALLLGLLVAVYSQLDGSPSPSPRPSASATR